MIITVQYSIPGLKLDWVVLFGSDLLYKIYARLCIESYVLIMTSDTDQSDGLSVCDGDDKSVAISSRLIAYFNFDRSVLGKACQC